MNALLEDKVVVVSGIGPGLGVHLATQAAEALKLLAGAGESLAGRLLLLDTLSMQWRDMRVPRDPACPVCRERPLPSIR